MKEVFDVIVIGAGTNGLAAAAVLAKAGRRVLVIDRANSAGGQTRVLEFASGFKTSLRVFDAGWIAPSVMRSTGVAAPAASRDLQTFSVATAPNELFTLPAEAGAARAIVSKYSAADAGKWNAFARMVRNQASVLEQLYQIPAPRLDATTLEEVLPLLGIATSVRRSGAQSVFDFLRTLPMSVADLAGDEFSYEPLKAIIAAAGVQGIRQGPRSGGTTFVLLHHLVGGHEQVIRGRSHFALGPDAFSAALLEACVGRGVKVKLATTVERITVADDRVTGVRLDTGEEIPAAAVLSTADPVQTLQYLIDPENIDPDLRRTAGNIKLRGCTAFVHYAMSGLPNAFGNSHTNRNPVSSGLGSADVVSLSASVDAIERGYDAVKYKKLADSPHIELTVASRRWPHFAPEGKHVVVARVHYVPIEASAGEVAQRTDAAILQVFPDFAERVIQRVVATPRDLENQYSISDGSLSHGELTLDQILFMRPTPETSSYSTPVPGLYLGGSGSHPGPGVLGAAGTLAAREILRPR